MNEDIIYQLTVEDINTVSEEELGRKLTADEIDVATSEISKRIQWYDIVADVINEKISK